MNRRWLFFSFIWLVVVVGGCGALMVYSHTPGQETGEAPRVWPAASRIAHDAKRPTLVMFAHPKCPCTRASIGELSALMTRSQGRLDARVVFFRPDEVGEDWTRTDLWTDAAAIPGVTVAVDHDGLEARHFHAGTSGHVVLYDASGRLLFSGGITEARGHAGDNAGRDAITRILDHGPLPDASTPTFGCPIQQKETPQDS